VIGAASRGVPDRHLQRMVVDEPNNVSPTELRAASVPPSATVEPARNGSVAPSRAAPRLGPVRRVLFFGKSMSRTRCSGAIVDALREHGVEVRWRNLVTLRRWFGTSAANRLARAEFRRYR